MSLLGTMVDLIRSFLSSSSSSSVMSKVEDSVALGLLLDDWFLLLLPLFLLLLDGKEKLLEKQTNKS